MSSAPVSWPPAPLGPSRIPALPAAEPRRASSPAAGASPGPFWLSQSLRAPCCSRPGPPRPSRHGP
eukprot:1597225-Alexandrium_andersonii.AAC.1